MKLLPARCLLAVAVVTDVALHGRRAPVTAKALASRHNLAPRHFETLLQDLAQSGILKAFRGARGGYELARERRRISMGDIVRASAGFETSSKNPKPRPGLISEVVEPALADAETALFAALDRVTVDRLCQAAEGGAAISGERADFTI